MTTITDRPDMAERYGKALNSKHLEVITDERCSVDMLVAAGWVKDGLGTALYRLRSEFDSARGQAVAATRALGAMQAQLDRARRAANAAADTDRVRLKEIAKHLGDELERAALTERAMLLVHLKTLDGATIALGRFALALATREAPRLDERAVRAIAGRALDCWLDPLCPHCNGTGAVGGYGEPRSICTECSGSTKRQIRLGSDNAGHEFGRHLMTKMDAKADYVTGQMRRYLANR